MDSKTIKLYSLPLTDVRGLLLALLFIIGNVALPQVCHLVPQGGFIFLPIYFFTLIASYKYGWRVGLLTAIASPIVNHLLFGMPTAVVMPALLIKSVILAGAASFVAKRFNKVNILLLTAVVVFYQVVGSVIESALAGSFAIGFADFRLGLPGMALQIFGGWLLLKHLSMHDK